MEIMNPYKWVKILFSIIGLLITISVKADEMSIEKFLELHIQSEKIDFYININNVEVFSEVRYSPINQVVPVNQWIYGGVNTLLISVNFEVEDDKSQLQRRVFKTLCQWLVKEPAVHPAFLQSESPVVRV